MTSLEYRTEIIPLQAGPKGQSTMVLNSFGADGWDLVSCQPVPVGSGLLGNGQQGLGLLCVLKRVVDVSRTPAAVAETEAAHAH